jgi:hypothetical protein
MVAACGAVVGGRGTYEAAGHGGDANPWGLPFFIVTHRPEEQPPGDAFTFVEGVPQWCSTTGNASLRGSPDRSTSNSSAFGNRRSLRSSTTG